MRRLSAIEALGSVTVVATDKTGTLTDNRMEVRSLDAPDLPQALTAVVLAVASAPGEAEDDLALLGLALFWDPPRPEVADAVHTRTRRASEWS